MRVDPLAASRRHPGVVGGFVNSAHRLRAFSVIGTRGFGRRRRVFSETELRESSKGRWERPDLRRSRMMRLEDLLRASDGLIGQIEQLIKFGEIECAQLKRREGRGGDRR